MNTETEPLQSKSLRAPQFGRDVLVFSFFSAAGFAMGVFAFVGLIGVMAAENYVPVALFTAVGAFGFWFTWSIMTRLDRYDEWQAGRVIVQQPARAMELQPKEEAHYWVALDGAQLRLPAEPKPGAMREFCQALSTGRKGFNERDAAEFGYPRRLWHKLRNRFIEEGWGEWKDENDKQQGVELTMAGMDIIRAIAANRPPTPFDSQPPVPVLPTHTRTNARTNAPVQLGKRVV